MMKFQLLVLFAIFRGPFGAIHEGPSNQTSITGEDILLICSIDKDDQALWIDAGTSTTIFVGDKFYGGDKYNNFKLQSTSETQYNLLIQQAQIEDEGSYACQLNSGIRETAFITLEVVPTLSISIKATNDDSSPADVIEGTNTTFECSALSSKPAVSLNWMVDENFISSSLNTTVVASTDDPGTFDVHSEFIYTPIRGDVNVTCYTEGQKVATSMQTTQEINVQFQPNCTTLAIYHEQENPNLKVTCVCDAHPLVDEDDYVFTIWKSSGSTTPYTGNILWIQISEDVNISCTGNNIIGSGISDVVVISVSDDSTGVKEFTNNNAHFISVMVPTMLIVLIGCIAGIYYVNTVDNRKKKYKQNTKPASKYYPKDDDNLPDKSDNSEEHVTTPLTTQEDSDEMNDVETGLATTSQDDDLVVS